MAGRGGNLWLPQISSASPNLSVAQSTPVRIPSRYRTSSFDCSRNRATLCSIHSQGQAQYRSLKHPAGCCVVDTDDWMWRAGTQVIAAHLALDRARGLSAAAAFHPLFQDFVEHRGVQSGPGPRGEALRSAAICAGSAAPRGGKTAGLGPRPRATQPHASARARQSAPAAVPRPPGAPVRGSSSATPPGRRAGGSSIHPARPRFPSVRDPAPPGPRLAPPGGREQW
jgi:hypothetical protein